MKKYIQPPQRVMARIGLMKYIEETNTLVNNPKFMERSRTNPKYFSRTRKMPFKKLIYFMFSMIKESTQNALERFFSKMGEDTYMSQQSFSEARQKLKASALEELFKMTETLAYTGYFETWQGYRVMAIDGTKIALPSDINLRNHFGTTGEGSTSPTAQGSILYDIYNKVVVDAIIEPMSVDERTLAERHIKVLCSQPTFNKELIIFDRGYPSFELIKSLVDRDITFLMRVKRKFNTDIDNASQNDTLITLHDGTCSSIKVRIIKLQLPTGEIETLITNLFDRRLGTKAFKTLYFKRWPVETKYDELKNKLELANFSGRTVEAIKQDFFAAMYLANVGAAAHWEAQAYIDAERQHKNNKYDYQVNINHAVGVLKDHFIRALIIRDTKLRREKIKYIISLMTKKPVPIRTERVVDRKKSSRNVKFHHNKKSNC